jgi:ABC-type transport system involved in multi-copper enzyme maturation permease subunit
MAWHLGPGPIFVNECVLTARRWQTFFVRGLTGLLLLGLVALVYNSTIESIRLETSSSLAEQARARDNIGQALMTSILVLQLVMVIFVAPATMAGAICIEKARGTLLHLLVTDLRSHEIILGKLAARFLHIFGLIGISLPIFLILTTVVSIEPEMVLGGYMVLVGVAVLYSAMSLTVSVYGQKPHEVLVASMLLVVLLLLLGPAWVLFVSIVTARDSAGLIIVGGIAALVAFIVMLVASPAARQSVGSFLVRMLAFLILVALSAGVIDYLRETLPAQATNWLMPTNPFYIAFYRYINPNDPDALRYQGVFLIVHLGLAGLLVLGCTLRLRAVAVGQASRGDAPKPRPAQKALAEQPADTATAATADAAALPRADAVDRPSLWQRLLARLPGPGLDGNPVLWREWHRRRPSRLMRGLWAFVAFVAIFFSVLSFLSIMFISLSGNGFGGNPLAVVTVTGIVFVGLLLVSIASVGSLLEERQRGSLDVLLTTPSRPARSSGANGWGRTARRWRCCCCRSCCYSGRQPGRR